MKKLHKYLSPYIKECIIAPSFKMLEALFELFVPLVMVRLIDEGITKKDPSVIYQSGGMLILLGIIGLICALTAQFFAAKAAIGFATAVRNTLYDKILGFSHENFDTLGTSTLITRITADINQVQNGVNMVLRLLLRSPFIVFGAMIMAFTINVKAAIIFVLVIPVLFIAVLVITNLTIPLYKGIQVKLDTLTGKIRENLTGARVIRAFERSESEKEEFNKETLNLYKISSYTSKISTVLNPLTLIIVNVAMLILIGTGANLVNDGALTNGQVYALVNYMSQILVELVKLSNLFITINKSLASASRIAETLEVETPLQDFGTVDAKNLSGTENILSFENVSFRYPNAQEDSLSEITFNVKTGQTIGIIGGTGSGKTTLANLLMRFYDPGEGSIKYKGTDLKDITISSLRKDFSIVPQKAKLFTGSLKENLHIANALATEEEMNEAIKAAVASDIAKSKGEGLDFHITEGGANLSGGQKQRISIARALVKNSPVLILDDSSSALDYKTDAKLRANLKKMKNTVFIISQRIVSVKDADMILVMDDGKIVSSGTHEELLCSSPLYKEIYDSQTKEDEAI